MYKLTVTVHGNPDRNQDDWEENHEITAETVTELRTKVNLFQSAYDLGGGNWGIATLQDDNKVVGYMSYNGRVWDSMAHPAKEIMIP